jgi:S-DNA-T family DNA segregation ATPase FtsK/SpoIIIE
VDSGQASVSMLQRRFRIGYNRAARIIDSLEAQGIIGPADGSRPRQVLLSEEEFREMKENR